MADFKLEIRKQGWLADFLEGGASAPVRIPSDWTVHFVDDGCSHGSIYCEIGGVQVSASQPEYGISQSALALLRSIDADSVAFEGAPLGGEFVLCHGCGYPLGLGCTNFGTNWVVRHEGDHVVLSDVMTID